jgi:regulator-associated protein of mTOR
LKPTEGLPVVDSLEHKAMCAFILARLCDNYVQGKRVCNQTDIMGYCLAYLQNNDNPLLRQWACLCLSQLWEDYQDAQWQGIRQGAPEKLAALVNDVCCEVRAAMLFAMTTFIGIKDLTEEIARIEEEISWTVAPMANDGNAMVRKELLVYFSKYIQRYENKFLVAAYEQLLEERDYRQSGPKDDGNDHKMGLHYARSSNRDEDGSIKASAHGVAHNSIFAVIWKRVLILAVDPHPEVQRNATIIVDYIYSTMLQSPIGPATQTVMDDINRRVARSAVSTSRLSDFRPTTPKRQNTMPSAPAPQVGLLKRTASYLLTPFVGNASAESSPENSQMSPRLPAPQRNSLSMRSRMAPDVAPPEMNYTATTSGSYHDAKEPLSGGFQPRKMSVAPTIPLKSVFFEWSIEYFREPQMKPNEAEEPGSTDYNERLWRRSRNEAILLETQPQKEIAGSGQWNNSAGYFNNGSQPSKMTFHQFEDHLAVADDKNTVCVWDWKKTDRLCRFSNGNPEGSRVSGLQFINEDDQAFLLTGSTDGVIRIYRNYDSDKKIEVASAWRALTRLVPSTHLAGMVFDWQQVSGKLLVAGDEKVIRVWAAAPELCIVDINARSGSPVTSLTSDQMTGNVFVAGFGDGAIRVFDARNRPQEAMVRRWKDSNDTWISSVHMQRGGQRELVSASKNGKVKLWDLRADKPLKIFKTTNQTLHTASIHEHLPVFSV